MEQILSLVIMLSLMWIVQGQTEPKFDIIVAQDGSGNFTEISEAVSAAPDHSTRKYYIRIKAGIYVERIHVGREKTNIGFIGDGKDVTIITYNRSNGTGNGINESATADIEGDGFIAKYITFNNSAGPSNGQAIAMKSTSNFSAFYQCRFQGYQDTLFVDKGIQFYRESEIFGTIDFIFGDATVVFQNCDIYVHNPCKGQLNVITAQRREIPEDTTGISMHNCTIMAAQDFNTKSGIETYLGRPWSQFSTVVIMQSFLDDLIDPQGWLQWDNNDVSTLKSLYYREYQNRGPGASTTQRVNWKGFGVINSYEAEKFTVRKFIIGDTWLPPTNIPFFLDLIEMENTTLSSYM